VHYSARTESVLQCSRSPGIHAICIPCYTAFLGTKVVEITQEHILIGIVALAAIGVLRLLVWGDPDEKQGRDGG